MRYNKGGLNDSYSPTAGRAGVEEQALAGRQDARHPARHDAGRAARLGPMGSSERLRRLAPSDLLGAHGGH
jgi:hypothetical protein